MSEPLILVDPFTAVRGVYGMFNLKTGRVYVGASKNILQRWHTHVGTLDRNNHNSKSLQEDWNRGTKFVFVLLERVSDRRRNFLKIEELWKERFPLLYNIATHAVGCPGRIHTDAERKRTSDARKGIPQPGGHFVKHAP